ncbi:MAG: hypothetical protein K0S23_3159 [Fluviicola sp.]|jgi:hypothetical protein|uniref:hypothetical protein n=1 Tax=Fluviicola sp. TaxID=1917219 RepID=UPI002611DB2E|nr:hypothetical protein [Fluviicola sp.]MDF3028852.1 hypothetical protein [Fluviicola sp.]
MAVSKKGKRTITVDGKTYLWWVFDEVDQTFFDNTQIKLISEDQSHYIKYGLEQADDNRSVVIGLHNNPGLIQLECPKFEDERGIITPSGIRQLIEWCKTQPSETAIRVIKHAYEPKLHALSDERIQQLYKRILYMLNK